MKYISIIVVFFYVLMSSEYIAARYSNSGSDAYFYPDKTQSIFRNQTAHNTYPYSRFWQKYNRNIVQQAARVKKKHKSKKKSQNKQSSFALQATANKHEPLIQEQEKYRHDLGLLENEFISRDAKEAHHQARIQALRETQYNNNRTTRSFALSRDVCTFAQEYDITASSLTNVVYNAYEYQLHIEFLEQLTQAAELKSLYNQAQEHDVFLDMVGHSVAFGMEANRDNDALTATYWSDIAWKSLGLASAVGEGLALGVYNTAMFVGNAIKHPVETLKTVVHGAASVVGMLAQATGAVLKLHALEHRGHHDQLKAELDVFVDQMDCVIDHCSDQLSKMPLREKVKHVTAFGAELIIPGKAFKVVHNICSRMRPVAIGLFHALRDEQKAVQVAARVEGVAENISMRVVEATQEAEVVSQKLEKGLGLLIPEAAHSYKHIISAIENIGPNKIHHILTLKSGKHAWHKVIENEVTWEKVKAIITKVMCEDKVEPYKAVFKKWCYINGEIVEVVFAPLLDGTIAIADAWVRTV